MLELYHSNWSVCAQKVRLVLAEKGLEAVEHHIDLRAREQQTQEYLELNPRGYVPTLVHDGRPVIESAVICEYLDEVFPEPPLRPADPVAKAWMRTWTRRPDETIHRACATLTNAIAFRHQWLEKSAVEIEAMLAATPDPVRREWRRETIERGTAAPSFRGAVWAYDNLLSDMEDELAGGGWLAGDVYSLADVALTSYLNRAAELSLHPMWEKGRPRVAGWLARVRARPSFARAFDAYPYPDYQAQMAEKGRAAWPKVEAILAAG